MQKKQLNRMSNAANIVIEAANGQLTSCYTFFSKIIFD